jgi:hypothetical protein
MPMAPTSPYRQLQRRAKAFGIPAVGTQEALAAAVAAHEVRDDDHADAQPRATTTRLFNTRRKNRGTSAGTPQCDAQLVSKATPRTAFATGASSRDSTHANGTAIGHGVESHVGSHAAVSPAATSTSRDGPRIALVGSSGGGRGHVGTLTELVNAVARHLEQR